MCDFAMMKWLGCLLLLVSPLLMAEELDGDVWYDADGKVAYVEGPGAEGASSPFVPAWERRARERDQWKTDPFEFRYHHRQYYRQNWYADYGWFGYPGWSVYRPHFIALVRRWAPCRYPRWGSPVIIIR